MRTKKLLFTLLFLSVLAIANAQMFSVGDKVFNAGVGLGTTYGWGKMTIPPLSLSGEYGFKEGIGPGVIGIGAIAGISGSKHEYWSGLGWKYTYIIVGLRGTYHYEFIEKLDTYGGLMLGYNLVLSSAIGSPAGSANGSAPALGGFVGGRYYFTEKIGAFAELGYGIAYLTLGFAIKLGGS